MNRKIDQFKSSGFTVAQVVALSVIVILFVMLVWCIRVAPIPHKF